MTFDFSSILLGIVPVLSAITLHEAAHAWMAKKYGDPTAFLMGRVTLNPVPHIDPIGTVLLPLLLIGMGSPFLFGWAKPVPVLSRNFKNVRIGMRMVALAGPLSNVLMVLIWALLGALAVHIPVSFGQPLMTMAQIGVVINAFLFAFNMLPLLPLDGGRVVDTFLSARQSMTFQKIEPYGFWIILALAYTGVTSFVIWPIVSMFQVVAHGIISFLS